MPSSSLPDPPAEDRLHSEQLTAVIRARIHGSDGWISFADYMDAALYTPNMGYYSAGSRKLGPGGDFTTAPELTPLFGAAIARQAAQLIHAGCPDILELGAGSGALAVAMLEALDESGTPPGHYYILEVSADLRERQRACIADRLPQQLERVRWLDRLPESFSGLLLGNEVLDAMPVNVFRWNADGATELGVALDRGQLEWSPRKARAELRDAVAQLAATYQWPSPYRSELGLIAQAFIGTIARMLRRGVALFIDYGFPAREYYHAQRSMGTLRCHYRHRAHDDPFFLPGLCDITAHVDFSAIASSAVQAGLQLGGFTTQARLLINCGITELLLRTSPADTARYLPQANAVQRLLSPAEMGELFKAIALTQQFDEPLVGFASGDRRATL